MELRKVSNMETEIKCKNCGTLFTPRNEVHKYCSKKCSKQGYYKNGCEEKTPLSQTHLELMKEWDWEKNKEIGLNPDQLTHGSSKKSFWICKKNKKHKWKTIISNRTKINGNNCPYCAGQKVTKENCLKTNFPVLCKEWNYKKNKNLTPKDVMPKSNKMIWWICSQKHEWESIISDRTNGSNCPYCTGKKVCLDNCLSTINPKLAKEWNYKKNKNLTPKDVMPGSKKKIWWICSQKHEWKAIINSRNRGSNCPYCSGNKICNDNCLSTKFPEIAKEWHPTKNGELTPEKVMPKSHKRIWWICSQGHDWESAICSRTNGRGCYYCVKKNEGKVGKLLFKYFKDWTIIPGKRIWYKYKDYNHKRFCDFWLEKNGIKIIIEYDGRQHFMPVCFNGISIKKAKENLKHTQIKDKLDTEFCKENNIILWRIKYDEDKEKSIKELLKKIEQL